MHRNVNHHFNNGNTQRRPLHNFRTSLRRHIEEKWMITFIGIVGFLGGIILIIGNEASAVKVSKLLEESISLVTTLSPDEEVDKSNVGKLVYITGMMTIHEPLTEPDYGISVLAVKLYRNVQMYQWVETESDVIDGEGNVISTYYNYHTEWQNSLVDSSFFASPIGHRNPKEFSIKRQTQINENVKIGKYRLGLELKKKFTNFIPITSDERPERTDIKLHTGLYYHCQDIWKPEVGDIRVQFSYAGQHGQELTIVAKLDETLTLVPYSKYNLDILFLRYGHYNLEDMFALVHSQNKFLTWVYRGGGWFILYLSCICLSTILQTIVSHSDTLQDVLPIDHFSLNMTVSMCISLFATALSWVWYRPVLGLGLIFVTMSLLFFTKWFSGNPPLQSQYNRL